jgi:hypothetical protein
LEQDALPTRECSVAVFFIKVWVAVDCPEWNWPLLLVLELAYAVRWSTPYSRYKFH